MKNKTIYISIIANLFANPIRLLSYLYQIVGVIAFASPSKYTWCFLCFLLCPRKAIVQKLIELSEGYRKIILYASPWVEDFYAKLGFKRMNTAMGIFQDEAEMLTNGTISEP